MLNSSFQCPIYHQPFPPAFKSNISGQIKISLRIMCSQPINLWRMHLLQFAYDNDRMRTHDVTCPTFASIMKEVSFHMVWKQSPVSHIQDIFTMFKLRTQFHQNHSKKLLINNLDSDHVKEGQKTWPFSTFHFPDVAWHHHCHFHKLHFQNPAQ